MKFQTSAALENPLANELARLLKTWFTDLLVNLRGRDANGELAIENTRVRRPVQGHVRQKDTRLFSHELH